MRDYGSDTIFNNDELASWFAGLYEGEGCITQHVRTKSTRVVNLRLTICMTDFDVIEQLPKVTGMGRINSRPAVQEHHKNAMVWSVAVAEDVHRLIDRIRPWLGHRRTQQVDMAVEAYRDNRPYNPSLEERFWSRVERTDDHWLWQGFTDKYGFGTFTATDPNDRRQAHRFVLELQGRDVTGVRLKNTCGLKSCVRPDHWSMNLTPDRVLEIKNELSRGVTPARLADKYGVTASTISNIKLGKSWTHVGEARDES